MDLVKRKIRWGLTPLGWLVIAIGVVLLFYVGIKGVFPFLAVNEPVQGDILVVEGWLPDYAIEKVIEIFKSGGYSRIVTTGGPLTYGSYLVGYKTYPEVAGGTLKALGFDENLITVVPAPDVMKDDTYTAGVFLRKWLTKPGTSVSSLDICSMGPHARRTRMLFEKALGDSVDVGIISLEDREYDAKAWWKTSDGVRTVIKEAVAYIYAKFFFRPKEM